MQLYAQHFNLLEDVVFGASVRSATRNKDDTRWRLELLINGETHVEEFDKVAFCHGYQTKAVMPEFEDRAKFEGKVFHSQQFRKSVL